MRTLLLLSALAVVVACSDDRQMTGPADARNATLSDVHASAATARAASKPTPEPTTPSFSSITTVVGITRNVLTQGPLMSTSTATCPAGYVAIGGGFAITHGGNDVVVLQNKPTSDGTGWAITAQWFGGTTDQNIYGAFNAVATCIK
jgi:hypothetical protein